MGAECAAAQYHYIACHMPLWPRHNGPVAVCCRRLLLPTWPPHASRQHPAPWPRLPQHQDKTTAARSAHVGLCLAELADPVGLLLWPCWQPPRRLLQHTHATGCWRYRRAGKLQLGGEQAPPQERWWHGRPPCCGVAVLLRTACRLLRYDRPGRPGRAEVWAAGNSTTGLPGSEAWSRSLHSYSLHAVRQGDR